MFNIHKINKISLIFYKKIFIFIIIIKKELGNNLYLKDFKFKLFTLYFYIRIKINNNIILYFNSYILKFRI